jgi:hypothetical protein
LAVKLPIGATVIVDMPVALTTCVKDVGLAVTLKSDVVTRMTADLVRPLAAPATVHVPLFVPVASDNVRDMLAVGGIPTLAGPVQPFTPAVGV